MVLQTNLENMLPNPDEFGKCFHELFKQPSDNQRFVILTNKYTPLLFHVIVGNVLNGKN